jgi:hypothetical protein
MIVHGLTPNRNYIRYAFLRPIERQICFYFAAGLGDSLRLADGRDPVVGWNQLVPDGQPSADAFSVRLAGFETIVTPATVRRNGVEMIDRLRMLEQPTPLGPFRITFDWSGEPAVEPVTRAQRGL